MPANETASDEWPDDIPKLLSDLWSASDRSFAIIGGSFIDHFLGLAIMSRMRPISGQLRKDLFERSGALATRHARINVGFALRVYESDAAHDLHLVRRIRNKFAHSMKSRRFGDADIGDLCGPLRSPSRIKYDPQHDMKDPKQRFLATVLHLATGLAYEAHNGHGPEPPQWLTDGAAKVE